MMNKRVLEEKIISLYQNLKNQKKSKKKLKKVMRKKKLLINKQNYSRFN